MNVKLNLPSAERIISSRGLGKNSVAQKVLATEVARQCDPYVPMRSGVLKNTAQVQADGVLYNQPYAHKQYTNNAGRGIDGTADGGRRGAYWDKRAMADHGAEVTAAVAKVVGGKVV